MFGSNILEIVIGLSFLYLLLSLICSTVNEVIQVWLKTRALNLESGIKEFVGATANGGNQDALDFVAGIYNHGLVNSLFEGEYKEDKNKKQRELPSYIPSKNFTLALIATIEKYGTENPPKVVPKNVVDAIHSLIPDATETMKKDYKELSEKAHIYRAEIENWYDAAMERVSGQYKRMCQKVLLLVAIILAVLVNADSVAVVRRLASDPSLRQCIVTAAQARVADPNTAKDVAVPTTDFQAAKQNLDSVSFPIGWKPRLEADKEKIDLDDAPPDYTANNFFGQLGHLLIRHTAGWVLTAVAISLGAPFWFDVLNKLVSIRSTVKPYVDEQKDSELTE